jgi:hypothetical protein
MLRKSVSSAVLAALAIMSALAVACGGSDSGSSSDHGVANEAAPAPGAPAEVPTRWASAIANDLPSLLDSSDEVFVGRVTRVTGQRDEPAGAPRTFPITRYEVSVEQSISGTLTPGAAVVVEQGGGTIRSSDGTETRVILHGDEFLVPGASYLFFAGYKSNGTLAAPPFSRLRVAADGALHPLHHWASLGALQQLAGLSAVEAARAVGEAE